MPISFKEEGLGEEGILEQKRPSAVSSRAILLGTALIPINCYWLVISRQPYQYQSIPTIISPFSNVIFILSVMIVFNWILLKFAPRAALKQGEFITVYIMLSLTSAIQSFQMMQTLVTVMEHPFAFATPENDWENLFGHYIPSWLSVRDQSVLQPYYYEGDSTLYIAKHIKRWLLPSLCWSAFVVVLVLVMGYITALFKRPWVESERLAYPIIQLPLEMTAPGASIFRNKLLWIGAGISGGLALINGFASLYPTLPALRIHPYYHNLARHITSRPWNAIPVMEVGIIFPIVGLAFFMPLDMSFSCFFFFLFGKIQQVFAVVFGSQRTATYHLHIIGLIQQSFGALLGVALVSIWAGRKHLSGMFRGNAGDSNSDRPISHRSAMLGIVLGIGFLTAFLWQAGMAIWLSITFFLLYYAISFGLTRIRAEIGVPLHDFHFTGPDQVLPEILGPRRVGYKNLTIMSMLGFFNFTYRAHPQPHQMEGLALLDRAHLKSRHVFLAMTLALVVGTISFFWIYLHIAYSTGGSSLQRFSRFFYTRLANWINHPSSDISLSGIRSVGIGVAVVLVLTVMRRRFLWWRLHPAAYAISNSLDINHFWFSILISFVAKWLLIRHGGIGKYRQVRPFFLGLILGDYIVGSIWTIVGDIIHRKIFYGGSI